MQLLFVVLMCGLFAAGSFVPYHAISAVIVGGLACMGAAVLFSRATTTRAGFQMTDGKQMLLPHLLLQMHNLMEEAHKTDPTLDPYLPIYIQDTTTPCQVEIVPAAGVVRAVINGAPSLIIFAAEESPNVTHDAPAVPFATVTP